MSENQEVLVSEDSVAIQEAAMESRFDNEEARADLEYINRVIQDNIGEPLLNMLSSVQQDTLQSEAVKGSLNADITFLTELKNHNELKAGLFAIVDTAKYIGAEGCSDFVRNHFYDLARRAEGVLGFIEKPE